MNNGKKLLINLFIHHDYMIRLAEFYDTKGHMSDSSMALLNAKYDEFLENLISEENKRKLFYIYLIVNISNYLMKRTVDELFTIWEQLFDDVTANFMLSTILSRLKFVCIKKMYSLAAELDNINEYKAFMIQNGYDISKLNRDYSDEEMYIEFCTILKSDTETISSKVSIDTIANELIPSLKQIPTTIEQHKEEVSIRDEAVLEVDIHNKNELKKVTPVKEKIVSLNEDLVDIEDIQPLNEYFDIIEIDFEEPSKNTMLTQNKKQEVKIENDNKREEELKGNTNKMEIKSRISSIPKLDESLCQDGKESMRVPFSENETVFLVFGFEKFPNQWARIEDIFRDKFNNRKASQLKDRYRTLQKSTNEKELKRFQEICKNRKNELDEIWEKIKVTKYLF